MLGSGPPLVCCNGVGVSIFFFKYIAEHFREHYTVVLWDYRGHGRSGTPPDVEHADLTIERNARDLQIVMDAAGISDPAILLGHSMGCQVILEFARLFPERAAAIIPLFGTFARPLDTFFDFKHSRKVFDLLFRVTPYATRSSARALMPLYASPLAFFVGRYTGLVDRHYADRVDIDKYLEHLVHMDQQVFLRMVSLMADHDLTEFLPTLSLPVLVIAGEKDLFTPLHRSREMAALVPGAELLVLAEGSHAAIVEHPETINRRVERFLQERLGLVDGKRAPAPRATSGAAEH